MLQPFTPPDALATLQPEIKTPPPGPDAQRWIELDRQFLSPSYTRPYPLVAARGQGAIVEDVDGNRFLDFTAGIAVCSTGHCHPRVVDAVARQSERLLHMSGTDFYYEPQIALARKLAELAPGAAPKRVFFTNSGTESVEAALKLARHHTGRPRAIAFLGAFHGRSMGALSLTASKPVQKRGFGPFLPGVVHVEYPDPYRATFERSEEAVDLCLERIETLFARTVPPDEVAAIFVEPIQGEGGYIVPPPDFHPRLKALAERHGILYVVDEVQTGMGRTGTMFAVEQFGVEPDVICLAKGIASGLPLGAIVARAELMDWPPGSHASTFGGNPVACAAALETIALLEEELIGNAAHVGELLLRRLGELKLEHELIGDVRGRGLMVGVELVRNPRTKERAADECRAVIQHCFRNGLLLLSCGESTLRLCPPLVIDERQAETAVAFIDRALRDVAAG